MHWYETEVLLPYLQEVRERKQLGKERRAVVIKDGEYEQTAMYKRFGPHFALLEDLNVDVRFAFDIFHSNKSKTHEFVGYQNVCIWICCEFPMRSWYVLQDCTRAVE